FPVAIEDMHVFENNNNISLNCFKNEGKNVIPIRLTEQPFDKHVNLLLLQNDETAHYVLILSDSLFGKHGERRHFYCKFCLKTFAGKEVMNKHTRNCAKLNTNIIKFLDEE